MERFKIIGKINETKFEIFIDATDAREAILFLESYFNKDTIEEMIISFVGSDW